MKKCLFFSLAALLVCGQSSATWAVRVPFKKFFLTSSAVVGAFFGLKKRQKTFASESAVSPELQRRLDNLDIEKNKDNEPYCTLLKDVGVWWEPALLSWERKGETWRCRMPYVLETKQMDLPFYETPRQAFLSAFNVERAIKGWHWIEKSRGNIMGYEGNFMNETDEYLEGKRDSLPKGPGFSIYQAWPHGSTHKASSGAKDSKYSLPVIWGHVNQLEQAADAKESVLKDYCKKVRKSMLEGNHHPHVLELAKGCNTFKANLKKNRI